MNYYPFHIGDYVSATRHLSWEEDAAFRRLLDTYYTTEKPIPADLRQACRLVMAQTESQREAVQTVLAEFFELTDSGWLNKRADAEIAAMKDKQQKQRDKANKRWGNSKPENPAMPRHEQSDAAAPKSDADAMPPTPTPTPTPIEIQEGGKPPKPPARRKPAPAFDLPDWIDAEAWAGFEAMRKAAKKGMTDDARRLAVSRLADLRGDGEDVAEVLRQSTFRCWSGLFPVKGDHQPQAGQPAQSFRERDAEAARADMDRLTGRSPASRDPREVIDITPGPGLFLELPHA